MGMANDLSEKLALDACNAAEALDDETIPEMIAISVGTTSPTTEELYRTAVRVIQAERRARKLLDARIRAAEDKLSLK
ncbi:MAG: hypothetical protein JKY00_10545 [Roseicyclus sp.]|nr:hypothetical protein [Roseicyclus sp.]